MTLHFVLKQQLYHCSYFPYYYSFSSSANLNPLIGRILSGIKSLSWLPCIRHLYLNTMCLKPLPPGESPIAVK